MLARKSKEACEESRSQEEEHWVRQLKAAGSSNKPPAGKLHRAASSTETGSSSGTDLDTRVEVFKTPASKEYGTIGQGGNSTSTSSLSPDNVTPQSLKRKLCTGDSVGSDSPNK